MYSFITVWYKTRLQQILGISIFSSQFVQDLARICEQVNERFSEELTDRKDDNG